jgi:hypothetical protein
MAKRSRNADVMLPIRQGEEDVEFVRVGNAETVLEAVGGEEEHVPGHDVVVTDGGHGGDVGRCPAAWTPGQKLLGLETRGREMREETGRHEERRFELVVPQG